MTNNTLAQKEPKSQPRRVKPSLSEADATITREGLVATTDRIGEAIAIAVDTESDELVVQRLTEAMLELWRLRWQLDLLAGDVAHAPDRVRGSGEAFDSAEGAE